ncbi:MAG TPA: 5-methyltetrahydropteroyltriglutamate--homocysteine S-methyltransferase [Hyphomicrobiales bacterium]|nr:5-methyltetrahydropteroyltriglutamate--homocysteine S-methyltransferase [Hyphomicrobiales bacterium]
MAARLKPPFRADQVGSLLRPPALAEARARHKAGTIGDAELRRVEDDCIRDAVKMQEEVGLKGITDGEFRRHDWIMDFKYALGGVRIVGGEVTAPFQSEKGPIDWGFIQYSIDEKIHLKEAIFAEHFKFLKPLVHQTAKITVPSPSMMHFPAGRGIDRKAYPDLDEFMDDLVRVYTEEMMALYGLGCRYLQFDDTSLAFLNSPRMRAQFGADGERQHETYIRVLNRIIAGKPADLALTIHLCRGNFRSGWISEGPYDHVAEALFGDLDIDGYFLEYDDQRSGGFEPLRYLPKGGKMVVLGLVTTKKPALEPKDLLKRRIEEASKFVDIDQLCLSPQCGFASTEEGNELTIEEEKAKLRLVVETAAEVWGG